MKVSQILAIIFCAFILWFKNYPPQSGTYTWEPVTTFDTLVHCERRAERDKQHRDAVWQTLTKEEKATMPNVVPVCFPGTFDPRGK
ncbi:MAG: hypothetical protein V3T60_16785 [Candidatus Binatia bacterium]